MMPIVLTKWKSLAFVHLLSYLDKAHQANNMQAFVLCAHLIRSLAQFDTMFEVKLVTHLLLQSSQNPGATAALQKTLVNFANLFYSTGPQSAAQQQ